MSTEVNFGSERVKLKLPKSLLTQNFADFRLILLRRPYLYEKKLILKEIFLFNLKTVSRGLSDMIFIFNYVVRIRIIERVSSVFENNSLLVQGKACF